MNIINPKKLEVPTLLIHGVLGKEQFVYRLSIRPGSLIFYFQKIADFTSIEEVESAVYAIDRAFSVQGHHLQGGGYDIDVIDMTEKLFKSKRGLV